MRPTNQKGPCNPIMYIDLFGKKRYKINLHLHTTRSDGQLAPEQALEIYRAAGYDCIAQTDHWAYAPERRNNGMLLLSGAEYNIGGADSLNGVYHLLGIGMIKCVICKAVIKKLCR